MKPTSNINKGKRMEKFIANEIQEAGFGTARRETGSGSGIYKGDIASSLPFLIEVKNQKTIKIHEWIKQAKEQARIGNDNPDKWSLVFRDPSTPESNPEVYAVIDFWQWLDLLKRNKEPKIKSADREFKWNLENLKISINKVLKGLE